MPDPRGIATVFGGTGFLGRRVVAALAAQGWEVRVAARNPRALGPGTIPVRAHLRDPQQVRSALAGARLAVNAVALYAEHGDATFQAIHVEGAGALAAAAAEAGAERLLHLSGVGSDPASASPYIRSRGLGEQAVRAAFPGATLLRPCVMFGPDDALLVPLAGILRRTPVFPLFGDGGTRMQPVHVGDVAAAAARLAVLREAPAVVGLGGPEILTYRTLVERVMRATGIRRPMVPLAFGAWRGLAAAASVLPSPPVTAGQVALMRRDNVADPGLPGLSDLGLGATPLAETLAALRR
jgi:uncharacterized protein YbjT (DUF2867 family)